MKYFICLILPITLDIFSLDKNQEREISEFHLTV